MTIELFHPVEHEILAQFFKTKSLHPYKVENLEEIQGRRGDFVGLARNADDEMSTYALENAVARLVLEAVQDRLPQWATGDKNGDVIFGRKIQRKSNRKLSFAPQCLFGINWANSGPGFSWPEDYYLAYVPLYNRYVITSSQDSPDVYGYTDIAIGHFSGESSDVIADAGRQIREYWSEHQNPWEEFGWLINGIVSEEMAEHWGWQVWGRGNYQDDYFEWLEKQDLKNGWSIEDEA